MLTTMGGGEREGGLLWSGYVLRSPSYISDDARVDESSTKLALVFFFFVSQKAMGQAMTAAE